MKIQQPPPTPPSASTDGNAQGASNAPANQPDSTVADRFQELLDRFEHSSPNLTNPRPTSNTELPEDLQDSLEQFEQSQAEQRKDNQAVADIVRQVVRDTK